jgi:hypothetical protein
MTHTARSVAALAFAALCAGTLAAPPAHAQDSAVQQELDALKKRIQALEDELAKSKKQPAGEPAAVKAQRGSRVQFGGYAGLRATTIAGSSGARTTANNLEFQVARFRPQVVYTIDPHWSTTLMLDGNTRGAGTTITLRDAFTEYKNAGYFGRLGQQKVPFGYEVFRESDTTRPALERARVFGVMFPSERDLGVVVGTASKNPRAPVLSAGVLNGTGINTTDTDKAKSVAVNGIVPVGKHNTVGASYYTGTTPFAGLNRAKTAVGVEHRLSLGRLSTQAEWLWGRAGGSDLNGGLGQLAYNTGRFGNLFARYDSFDPDVSALGGYFRRISVGWFKDLSPNVRITGEYDFVKDTSTPGSDNTLGVQILTVF